MTQQGTAKTNWTAADGVSAADTNRWETGIRDSLPKDGSEAMNGTLVIQNGKDLLFKAQTANDPGDIVFQNASGVEIGRLWLDNGVFKLRYASTDPLNTIWHSGNDGSGSGLDADLLDGKQGSEYVTKNAYLGDGFDFNTVVDSGFYRLGVPGSNGPAESVAYGQLVVCHGGGDTILQIVSAYNSHIMYFRNGNPSSVGGSGTWSTWYKMWNSGNMPATRIVNGVMEYDSTGGGVWKKVAGYGSTKYKGTFSSASTSYVTALSLTGTGSLRMLAVSRYYLDNGTDVFNAYGTVEITVDGTVYATASAFNGSNGNWVNYISSDGNILQSTTPMYNCDINFQNSLVVRFKTTGNASTYCNYVYELI